MRGGVRVLRGLIGRRPVPALLAGVAVAAVSAGLGVHLWAWGQLRAARAALERDRPAEARRHVERCLRVWSHSAAAHFVAARVSRLEGDYEGAEARLRACERLERRATEATQLEWVLLRAQRGEVDAVAGGLWLCVREGHPETAMILQTLARAYLRELRFHLARVCLDEWLRRRPDAVLALDWRGWVLERLHQDERARADYRRALELEPGRDEVRVRLVEVLLRGLNPLEALPHVERLHGRLPGRPRVLLLLARCRMLQGRHAEARPLLGRVLEAEPDNAEALYERGRLALSSNRPGRAEAYLRRAVGLAPHDPVVLYALQRSLRRQGGRSAEADRYLARFEKARAERRRLDELLTRQGSRLAHDPDLACEAGTLLLELGQEGPALRMFFTALNADPNHRRAHRTLARYHERRGDARRAAAHRERVGKRAGGPAHSRGR
jgi:tetratricopeptide (TPR) repeat protein